MAQILVVDDDPSLRHLLDVLLSATGHQIVEAGSAAEALKFLREHTPDMIIVDVTLPDLDGISLVNRVKNVGRLKEVPVVVITGGSPDLETHAKFVGAEAFLQKPVTNKALRETVGAILSERGVVLPGRSVLTTLEDATPQLRDSLPDEERFRKLWRNRKSREALLRSLENKGWGEAQYQRIREWSGAGERVDLFDLIGYLGYGWPLLKRSERATACMNNLWDHPHADVCYYLLHVYTQKGLEAMQPLDVLDTPEAKDRGLGGSDKVVAKVGGLKAYLKLLDELEERLYSISLTPPSAT
ncbi:MAG TPA: response regulator [Meiothermus sp.]|jgi:CheY-like chemotaxis protein|nr:response regulator [Meiothermus sp.]